MYLRSIIVEVTDRDKNMIRDIEAYLALRRQTTAAKTVFTIYEFGLNLVDEVYFHPAVTELINCIGELTLIDNVSFICRLIIMFSNHPLHRIWHHITGSKQQGTKITTL